MQNKRLWNVIRIVMWAMAGIVVLGTMVFAVTVVALPGCSTCHSSASFVSQTRKSAHASIDCVRCHAAAGVPHRVTYGYNLLFGQTLRVAPADGGPITAIPDSTCLSCHAAVMNGPLTSNGLSILHVECSKTRRCTDCHSDTAHGTAVKWLTTENMNQCLDCHNTDRVRADCNLCHVEKSQEQRIRSGEWIVTHGPSWRQTHGMGELRSCTACHPNDYCVKCHGMQLPHPTNFIRSHPRLAQTNRKECAVCHQQQFCDSCHGLPMPHSTQFTKGHSTIVKRDGKTLCLRCHIEEDCTKCHVKHVHPGGATKAPGSGPK